MTATETTTARLPAVSTAAEDALAENVNVTMPAVNMAATKTPARLMAGAAFALGMTLAGSVFASPPVNDSVSIAPGKMARVATVSRRYQSYNVEMAEVIGGNFWKPYTATGVVAVSSGSTNSAAAMGVAGQDPAMFQQRPPIDLSNARLRGLAAALGPAYVRVSGTWANAVYFDDSQGPPPATAPAGFQGVLTRSEWKNVVGFARAVNAEVVTSFTISAGVRGAGGVWTPVQARKRVAYTKSIGGTIAAAEFFNEPDMPTFGGAPAGYTAADYAHDFAVFRGFAKADVPDMLIVGPGSVGEGVLMPKMAAGTGMAAGLVRTVDMLSATPRPVFDVFSYHYYGAASLRCAAMGAGAQTTAADALSDEWLDRTVKGYGFYVQGLRDHFAPGRPVWITETADAACGGNPWAATFLDSFRYLNQLGRLAELGVQVIFHNTLASSEYGLLDANTFEPRPNYWAALLWHRLMGPTVLDAGPSRLALHLYAQCTPGQPGGVTVLAINNSGDRPRTLDLPLSAERYTLSTARLEDRVVRLNGKVLTLGADDAIPSLQGEPAAAGPARLAPATISFFVLAGAGNPACQ